MGGICDEEWALERFGWGMMHGYGQYTLYTYINCPQYILHMYMKCSISFLNVVLNYLDKESVMVLFVGSCETVS